MASRIFVVSPLDEGEGPLLHTIPMAFSECLDYFSSIAAGPLAIGDIDPVHEYAPHHENYYPEGH